MWNQYLKRISARKQCLKQQKERDKKRRHVKIGSQGMNIIKFHEYIHGIHEWECLKEVWLVLLGIFTNTNVKEDQRKSNIVKIFFFLYSFLIDHDHSLLSLSFPSLIFMPPEKRSPPSDEHGITSCNKIKHKPS